VRVLIALAATVLATPLLGLQPAAANTAAAARDPLTAGHAYRHGVIPFRDAGGRLPPDQATSSGQLTYGGGAGNPSIGVTVGQPRVYLVFWGSQWGRRSTDSSGYAAFSGDPQGMAPRLQAMFAGLGGNAEAWSGTMTQYCENVSQGTQTCSPGTQRVGYPTGGALAGVWEDTSASAPASATGTQLAQEAVNVADHFGNTTFSSNVSTQYIVVSPTGTHPDGFNTDNSAANAFCAWHSYTNVRTNQVAYTNLPYITDAGYWCGANAVNSGTAGFGDGISVVEGHEYAETLTDQNPDGGWLDAAGLESADKCAWQSTGIGAMADVSLSTGTFPMQSIWSNDAGGCLLYHSIEGVPAGPVSCVTPNVDVDQVTASGSFVRWNTGTALSAPQTWTSQVIGTGWSGLTVLPGGNGTIYTIDSAGRLHWYDDQDHALGGGANWAANGGAVIGTGWGGFRQVVSDGGGVIYALDHAGYLHWYHYLGSNGSASWDSGSGAVIGSGWSRFPRIIAGGDGIIYALDSSGNLDWYMHADPFHGSATWANNGNGVKIGTGWQQFSDFGSIGAGVIYAVDVSGDLLWYRHLDPIGGTALWANDGSPQKVNSGWAAKQIIPDTTDCIET
jgi:serine protease